MRAQTDSEARQHELRQQWETPDDFFGVVNGEFQFQLDAAATQLNKKCQAFISPTENALAPETSWIYPKNYRLWLNPGFGDLDPWVKRAYEEAQASGPDTVIVVLVIPSFSAAWWSDWALKASEIRHIGGKRIQFVPPPGITKSSNARENSLIIFRPNPHNLPPREWTWDWSKGR